MLAGSILTGCLSDPVYARIGTKEAGPYGYTEVATNDGGYLLRVSLPSYVNPQLPRQYWDRRAGELCNGHIARSSINTARHEIESYDRYGGRTGNFVMQGVVYCETAA
jgi:hypothetical protein